MNEFWILILILFLATNSLEKAESVKLELKAFDEIFGEGWDKDEADDLKTPAPTNFGQNVHHQIDRQNTQIGQIIPNSTDQLGQIEPNSTDQLGQIEPNSTDELGQIEPNSTDQNSPTPLKIIDEIFGEGWWDNEKDEEWNKLTLEHNFHHQIDRQNTQIGQIEPNSTDQHPPSTDSDHSDNAKNNEEQNEVSSNEYMAEDERKRKIVDKFQAMKNESKQKGKFSAKEWNQIENKIAKHLKVSRIKIYKWKKELGLSQKIHNPEKTKNERKNLIEKFDQMKAEIMRAGFRNSYNHEIDETVAKELGTTYRTIYSWKRKLGQITPQHKHSHSEQKKLMKRYYKIKDQNSKISDVGIAKMLKIGRTTLVKWKRQFKRQ